jgi:hypothetical protein
MTFESWVFADATALILQGSLNSWALVAVSERPGDAGGMHSLHSPRRAYDHRIREHICRTRNPNLVAELRIPRSTTTSWLRRPLSTVVSCQRQLQDVAVLREQVDKLQARVRRLAAVVHVQRTLLRVSGFSLEHTCLPDGAAKESVLRAVAQARTALPLVGILRIPGLSPPR